MHIGAVDLNLLTVAAALYRHANVSRAARELGLSQSAVSHALARLRAQFGDPFFVRTSRGVAPTRFAREVRAEVLDIVHRSELLVSRKTRFDSREATGRVTIATTDYFEIVAMPKLLPILETEAPGVQISIRPTVGELPKRDLEEGRADLAIAGFYSNLPEGFYQAKLFSDSFSVGARRDHPKAKTKLSLEEYFSGRHALITLQGDFRDPLAPSGPAGGSAGGSVRKRGRARKIVYGSYSFTGSAWVLERSDLLLTAPTLLLEEYRKFFPIRVWPCPVDVEGIDIQMIWHARTHEDPLHAWVRDKLRKALSARR